jgi:acetamidase/formamidase
MRSAILPVVSAAVAFLLGCTAPQQESVTVDYKLDASKTHNRWNRDLPPVLRVESGKTVAIETVDATDNQLSLNSTAADIPNVSFDPIHPLTGPIYVEGAEPGDVLQVDILDVEAGDWAWAGVFPGFGFLSDRFKEPFLKTFDLSQNKSYVEFAPGVRVPLNPFCGVMGVAPADSGEFSTIPPRENGGNMDNPHLTAGTTLYLPVFAEGALFSVGDGHGAQGDGEIGGTGVEMPLTITVRLSVRKDKKISEPQYETDEYYATTGFGTTIDEAAKKAANFMVDYLVSERGLSPAEAYVLSSLAANFKITETVDVPHMFVAMHLPKALFVQ